MESKFDYLTLTIKSKVKTLEETINLICEKLAFSDLMNKMSFKGRAGFYDYRLSYENIEFLLTTPERFETQGICIKFSGQGLDYFVKYLATYNLDLKLWFGKFRALSFGDLITKCTRLDFAMDDITKKGEKPLLTMDKVIKSAKRGEICKLARVTDIITDSDISSREKIKNVDGVPVFGRTLYLGSRKSDRLIRFYDKFAEQKQRGEKLPDNVVSWTRCECEFHDASAMSVFNSFIDLGESGFNSYMLGVMNNQCRFINRDNNNISRCSVKRWWTAFLNGCTKCFKLPHRKPARSALARAERGLSQYVRTVYTLFQELGLDGIYRFFENKVDELKISGKPVYRDEVGKNILEDIHDYEEMDGMKNYRYNSFYNTDEEEVLDTFCFNVEIQSKWFDARYRQGTTREYYRKLHSEFMNGQELITYGL